jgi:Flp pilus assembly protein TadG
MKKIKSTLSALKKAREGASAIEFAIVAPSLMLLLAGFIEIGIIIFVSSAVESGTNMSARIGITGYNGTTASNTVNDQAIRINFIKDQIYNITGALISKDKVIISVNTYGNYSDINTTAGIEGAGSGGDIVVYKTSYKYLIVTPLLGRLIGSGFNSGDEGKGNTTSYFYNIESVAVVRNEPSILQ